MIKPTESDYKCLQKSNRNTKEYSMTKTVSYNIKKVLAGTMLVALPFAFGGCEKDPVKPDNNKPKIARLVFDKNGHHIELDTIRYYLAQDFDSIYMIAEDPNFLSKQTDLHNARMFFQDRCNISTKVRGYGQLYLNSASNPDDRNAIANMGWNVIISNTKKSNQY